MNLAVAPNEMWRITRRRNTYAVLSITLWAVLRASASQSCASGVELTAPEPPVQNERPGIVKPPPARGRFQEFGTKAGGFGADWYSGLPPAWLGRALMLGVTLTLADEEGDIQAWIQTRRSGTLERVAAVGKPFGDSRYVVPALGLMYCYGRLSGSDRMRQTALLGLESAAVSGAITGALKFLSHKHRPSSGGSDDIPWNGPAVSTSHLSFPSGHSACAFAIATVVAMEYADYPLVPEISYGSAALCAFSRLNDNAHYMSDVIIGSAIGHFTPRALVKKHGGTHASRFGISPHVGRRGPGLAVSYRF